MKVLNYKGEYRNRGKKYYQRVHLKLYILLLGLPKWEGCNLQVKEKGTTSRWRDAPVYLQVGINYRLSSRCL
jgi:hypothetical protein